MELLDYNKLNKSLIKRRLIFVLSTIFMVIIMSLEFIPNLEWLQEVLLFSVLGIYFLLLITMKPIFGQNGKYNLADMLLMAILFIIWSMFAGLISIVLYGLWGSGYDGQYLTTSSGTFYVYDFSFKKTNCTIKKSYSYLPFVYTLKNWDNEPNKIQLDTSSNIVFANGEPIWNLTTDEFIPRITTLTR